MIISRKTKIILTILASGFLIFLSLYNQPYYPSTWFDEGLVLQGAMNTVMHGKYAMLSAEGFRVLDQPLIANGPGIVLPLSVMFSIFGVGLMQARLLASIFFLAAIWLFLRFTLRLYPPLASAISLLVLLAVPVEGFIMYGRQVLGNVPALAYFFAGCLFFVSLCQRKHVGYAFASGFFFGLALLTKGQYWLLIPVWGLVIFADVFYYKQMGLMNGIVLLGTIIFCFVSWQLVQFILVGAENYATHLDAISSSSKVTVFAFELVRFPKSLWYLVRSGFPIFILPALFVGAWESRERNRLGLVKFFLVVFVIAWVAWYLIVSIGWNRYVFEAYAVGSVLSGYAILKIKDSAVLLRDRFLTLGRSMSFDRAVIAGYLGVVIIFAVSGLRIQITNLISHRDTSAFQFTDFLVLTVSPEQVIESWEWQIDALAPSLTFHHPTNDWVDRKTAEIHFGHEIEEDYDPFEYHPGYLIVGPFSKLTGMYDNVIAGGCCTKVYEVGDYILYQVKYP